MQHVGKSDPVQHLIADSIDHAERTAAFFDVPARQVVEFGTEIEI